MFHLPAQWSKQDAILIAWPHQNTDWQPWLKEVESTYLELVKKISDVTKMIILVDEILETSQLQSQFSNLQINLSNIAFININYDDTWARDFGPITLQNKQLKSIAQNFIFNAWGDKFNSSQDNLITSKLDQLDFFQQPIASHDFILEGGSIESDGLGTLLTTQKCLLNPNRNSNFTKESIEEKLKSILNFKRVLWLKNGHLAGDDTDAHIDTLARFVNPNTIVFQGCQDPEDEHFEPLQKMKQELQSFKTLDNKPYDLIELPLASAQFNQEQDRLPASYVNFLISHKHIFVPIYQCEQDELTIEILEKSLPQYTIVPINCRSLIEQFGSLHCITMQLPYNTINQEFITKNLKINYE